MIKKLVAKLRIDFCYFILPLYYYNIIICFYEKKKNNNYKNLFHFIRSIIHSFVLNHNIKKLTTILPINLNTLHTTHRYFKFF